MNMYVDQFIETFCKEEVSYQLTNKSVERIKGHSGENLNIFPVF